MLYSRLATSTLRAAHSSFLVNRQPWLSSHVQHSYDIKSKGIKVLSGRWKTAFASAGASAIRNPSASQNQAAEFELSKRIVEQILGSHINTERIQIDKKIEDFSISLK